MYGYAEFQIRVMTNVMIYELEQFLADDAQFREKPFNRQGKAEIEGEDGAG